MKVTRASSKGTAILSVRIPRDLKNRLGALAEAADGNRSRLAVEALESYVEEQEAQLAKIDQGLRDADAGRVVPHEAVKRYLQSWGRKRRVPPPLSR